MRTNCRYSILMLAAVFTITLACFAQSAGDALANGDSASSGAQNDTPPILNAPHTLTRTVTIVQRLASGTTITRHMTIKQARDSNGRSYGEIHRLAPRPDGQQRDSVVYTLSDPQARTFMLWNSSSKTANLTRNSEQVTGENATPTSVGSQPHTTETPEHMVEKPQMTHEDLGTRTIGGLEARGTRSTRVIAVGQEGNDAPLTVTDEIWRSTKYGIVVLTVRDDPRSGTRTEEVTEFQPGEPDPALFQAPKGYTIREHTVVGTK
jgi:hypothetical protein